MPKIKLLPENLINQIAAGEVVERPASVVKELVENSLDAGATIVTVEVKDGGDTFLRVTDNGCGMDKTDAVEAFTRHATSKILSAEDLLNIRSLGFRGEAMASIASVSYMSLQTKTTDALEGTLVMAEGGNIKKVSSIGAPDGTQIEVRQLFYNTPARKKYLKNPATEYSHILGTLTGIALAFPEVSFRFIHDDHVVFDLPATAEDLTRIQALLGRTISDELVPVFYGHSQIQLKGYIGKPGIARGNRNSQFFFVNRREVKSHVLSYAVKQAFHSLLPKERYPVFLLSFNLDPAIVDVNVHPRKQEVRFADEKEIFKVVYQSCEKALEKHVLTPKIDDHTPENYYRERPHVQLTLHDHPSQSSGTVVPAKPDFATIQEALVFTKQMGAGLAEPTSPQQTSTVNSYSGQSHFEPTSSPGTPSPEIPSTFAEERLEMPEIIPRCQIGNSYILCEQDEALIIVDQHAAHERIRYTEIIKQFESAQKTVQPLLMPVHLELSHQEMAILQSNLELVQGMGFEIEPFGGNTFAVNAIPSYSAKEDISQLIMGLIDDLSNNAMKGDLQERKERALKYMACRSAVKFGDPLSSEEQKALLKQLQAVAQPATCPHGRPTMLTMDFDELEKRFGRRYI